MRKVQLARARAAAGRIEIGLTQHPRRGHARSQILRRDAKVEHSVQSDVRHHQAARVSERKTVRRRHRAVRRIGDSGARKAGLAQYQVGLLRECLACSWRRASESAARGCCRCRRHTGCPGDRPPARWEPTARKNSALRVVRRVVNQRPLKIGLPDHDVRLRAGSDLAQVAVAQNAVVIGVGYIEMRRGRRQCRLRSRRQCPGFQGFENQIHGLPPGWASSDSLRPGPAPW